MLRIILYVTALVSLFAGAIVYGGNAMGAWEPLPPAPTPPPAVKLGHVKADKVPKHAKGPAGQPTSAH
jgi:hypothetical protein